MSFTTALLSKNTVFKFANDYRFLVKKIHLTAYEIDTIKELRFCIFEPGNISDLLSRFIIGEGKTSGGDGPYPFIFHRYSGEGVAE